MVTAILHTWTCAVIDWSASTSFDTYLSGCGYSLHKVLPRQVIRKVHCKAPHAGQQLQDIDSCTVIYLLPSLLLYTLIMHTHGTAAGSQAQDSQEIRCAGLHEGVHLQTAGALGEQVPAHAARISPALGWPAGSRSASQPASAPHGCRSCAPSASPHIRCTRTGRDLALHDTERRVSNNYTGHIEGVVIITHEHAPIWSAEYG